MNLYEGEGTAAESQSQLHVNLPKLSGDGGRIMGVWWDDVMLAWTLSNAQQVGTRRIKGSGSSPSQSVPLSTPIGASPGDDGRFWARD